MAIFTINMNFLWNGETRSVTQLQHDDSSSSLLRYSHSLRFSRIIYFIVPIWWIKFDSQTISYCYKIKSYTYNDLKRNFIFYFLLDKYCANYTPYINAKVGEKCSDRDVWNSRERGSKKTLQGRVKVGKKHFTHSWTTPNKFRTIFLL